MKAAVQSFAGKPAPNEILVNIKDLRDAYFEKKPDASNSGQLVSFGTSGHRGTSLDGTFNELHVLAIAQAICDYRKQQGYNGILFLGKDTHFLSQAAQITVLSVFAANEINVCFQVHEGFTPTPVISWHILNANQAGAKAASPTEFPFSDGVVITPSHNPPSDGGIKYNPPNGGPADTDVTNWIQKKANEYLRNGLADVKQLPYDKALAATNIKAVDLSEAYIADLENIIDMKAIADAKLHIGVDPLGGAGAGYWEPIAQRYGLDITVVNKSIDPTFSFMTVDHDGKIRMDCSSSYAMQGLIGLKNQFDIAFANDPDTDRHGIVVPSVGLMNPNHYLAVAIEYLFTHRNWDGKGIGKTLVSSGSIDKVAESLGRKLVEVPVGFKWFVDGLHDGTIGFGGEESAGASFLRFDGGVWTTDKDGIILNLLAAEILAKTGKDPGMLYLEIEERFGKSFYTRVDQTTTPAQKAAFKNLTPDRVTAAVLADDKITAKLTNAPGNGAAIGGLKVVTANGWFAARPSGTENIYKIYAESFKSEAHLHRILDEARKIVDAALV